MEEIEKDGEEQPDSVEDPHSEWMDTLERHCVRHPVYRGFNAFVRIFTPCLFANYAKALKEGSTDEAPGRVDVLKAARPLLREINLAPGSIAYLRPALIESLPCLTRRPSLYSLATRTSHCP